MERDKWPGVAEPFMQRESPKGGFQLRRETPRRRCYGLPGPHRRYCGRGYYHLGRLEVAELTWKGNDKPQFQKANVRRAEPYAPWAQRNAEWTKMPVERFDWQHVRNTGALLRLITKNAAQRTRTEQTHSPADYVPPSTPRWPRPKLSRLA